MSYFPDLTPHTYTPADGLNLLNVGWLDARHPFPRGETTAAFRDALRLLCETPVWLHRGVHRCQFCPASAAEAITAGQIAMGNGQIRVCGEGGAWYAAPTMVHHYVVAHGYAPPTQFVDAVLRTAEDAQ